MGHPKPCGVSLPQVEPGCLDADSVIGAAYAREALPSQRPQSRRLLEANRHRPRLLAHLSKVGHGRRIIGFDGSFKLG
jgi:hypothetical protein